MKQPSDRTSIVRVTVRLSLYFALLLLLPASSYASTDSQHLVGVGVATLVASDDDSLATSVSPTFGRIGYSRDSFHLSNSSLRSRLRTWAEGGEDIFGAGIDVAIGYGTNKQALLIEVGLQERAMSGNTDARSESAYVGLGIYAGKRRWKLVGDFVEPWVIDRQFFRLQSVLDTNNNRADIGIGWDLWKHLNKNNSVVFEFAFFGINRKTNDVEPDYGSSMSVNIFRTF